MRRASGGFGVFAEASTQRAQRLLVGWIMAVVLVLNDDRDMLDMYHDALQAMGHEPVTQESSDAGPETVRQVGADALLVDLEAPDEAEFGLRVIQEVREDPQTRDLPIILATGATDELHRLHERLEALEVPVLIKPFEISALEEKLQAVLVKSG